MSTVTNQLVVFDFDWSMADQDTDRWIFEVLAPGIRRKMKTLKDEVQWTDLVAQSLQEIHARGVRREEIEDTLRIMPFVCPYAIPIMHPAMTRTVSKLKAKGDTTFLCLSNANSVFISTILASKGLQELFAEIVTNPAEWDTSGLLKVYRKVDAHGPQHNCVIGCSPNMCKGEELDAFLAKQTLVYDRIVYVGDGTNDFCAALRLRSQDILLCRSFRGLEKRIAREGGLRCEVKYWAGAWEVEEIFERL